MALVVKDRVRETSTTTGTGTITLAGAVTGYQSFSAIGNANTTYYTIYLQGGNEWEVGIGTYTASGTTLSRDTILASSNGGSAVNFSAGTKDVFVTYPAGRSVYYDTATNVTLNALTVTGALAANGGTTIGDASGDAFTINSSAVSTPNGLNFDSNTLVIDAANDRVGIGVASPAYKLDIEGTVRIGTGGSIQPILSRSGTSGGLIINTTAASAAGPLAVQDNSVNRLVVDQLGNVLIGTATNTNSSKLVADGTISETVSSTQYLVASQYDIGTAANEIPLNQYLGNLAYQDAGSIAGPVGLGGAVTLYSGTANGVLYLNGSKAVTTGSALTYSGNSLTSTVPSNASLQQGFSVTNATNADFNVRIANNLTDLQVSSATPLSFTLGASERMRLTGSSLNIGGNFTSTNNTLQVTGNAAIGYTTAAPTTGLIVAGDVGIGTSSPVQKLTVNGGLNVLGAATLPAAQGSMVFSYESPVSRCYMGDGTGYSFAFSKRVSSTTTDLMTLTDAGNLGIGTSPAYKLDVQTSAGRFQVQDYGAGSVLLNSDGAMAYKAATTGHQFFNAATQAMTLDASGNLGVGETSPSTYGKITLKGGKFSLVTDTATERRVSFWSTANGNSENAYIQVQNDGATTNTGEMLFATKNSGGTLAERARITSGGDFQVSSGGSVQVGGTAARATTAGTNRLDIFDGTAPVGTLTNGISIYSSSGEAYVMDAAGNATLFSPHDAETNEWIFKSKHTPTGKVLKIDVERLLKFVNDHFGLDAVHEFVEE